LAVRIAIESWTQRLAIINKDGGSISPIEHSMIHAIRMCDLAFSSHEISPEEFKARLDKIATQMKILYEHMETLS
jgi:hypothetical protein